MRQIPLSAGEDGEGGGVELYTVKWEAGQVGILVHISAVRVAHSHERGKRYGSSLAVALVLTA